MAHRHLTHRLLRNTNPAGRVDDLHHREEEDRANDSQNPDQSHIPSIGPRKSNADTRHLPPKKGPHQPRSVRHISGTGKSRYGAPRMSNRIVTQTVTGSHSCCSKRPFRILPADPDVSLLLHTLGCGCQFRFSGPDSTPITQDVDQLTKYVGPHQKGRPEIYPRHKANTIIRLHRLRKNSNQAFSRKSAHQNEGYGLQHEGYGLQPVRKTGQDGALSP